MLHNGKGDRAHREPCNGDYQQCQDKKCQDKKTENLSRLFKDIELYNIMSTRVFVGFAGCFELTIKIVRALLR